MAYKAKPKIKAIEDYVTTKKSIGTTKAYRSHLRNYFETINKDPNTYISIDVRKIGRNTEIDFMDAVEKDLRFYSNVIKDEPPKTQEAKWNAIKGFLEHNYIEFKKRVWKDLQNCKSVAITEKRTLQPQDFRHILNPADEIEKAFFLMLATSGMRIDELANIEFEDIKDRVISIRYGLAKSGKSRFTFITKEAQSYLDNWISKRKNYMITSMKKSQMLRKSLSVKGYKFEKIMSNKRIVDWKVLKNGKEITFDEIIDNDDRIFPFETNLMRTKWNRLLENAGEPFNTKSMKTKHGRYVYNVHSLKRYCKSRLRITEMKEDWINMIVAHDTGLDKTYADDDLFKKQIKVEYDKYSSVLSVFSDKHLIDIEYKPKLERMDTTIGALYNENKTLQKEVANLKKLVDERDYEIDRDSGDANAYEARIKQMEEQIKRLSNLVAGLPKDFLPKKN